MESNVIMDTSLFIIPNYRQCNSKSGRFSNENLLVIESDLTSACQNVNLSLKHEMIGQFDVSIVHVSCQNYCFGESLDLFVREFEVSVKLDSVYSTVQCRTCLHSSETAQHDF